jgi:hypothetical protein
MVLSFKVFKNWVSHRIDDPALPFVTPALKKDETHEKSPESAGESGDVLGWMT